MADKLKVRMSEVVEAIKAIFPGAEVRSDQSEGKITAWAKLPIGLHLEIFQPNARTLRVFKVGSMGIDVPILDAEDLPKFRGNLEHIRELFVVAVKDLLRACGEAV